MRACQKWTPERIARLALLIGCGKQADEIARDPMIRTTKENVRVHASRFGLSSCEKGPRRFVQIDAKTIKVFEEAASIRQMSCDDFIRDVLRIMANEPYLISNVMDDGLPAQANGIIREAAE